MNRSLSILSKIAVGAFFTAFSAQAMERAIPESFPVKIGSFEKEYPVVTPQGTSAVKIVYMPDINDNFKLNASAATFLAQKIIASIKDLDVIVMPGDKATMMGTLLVTLLKTYNIDVEIVVVRSTDKGGSVNSIEYKSITHKDPKKLHLRQDQLDTIKNKKVLLFDDIISSGETMRALMNLVNQAGGNIQGFATLGTEGVDAQTFEGYPLLKLIHLPVYLNTF